MGKTVLVKKGRVVGQTKLIHDKYYHITLMKPYKPPPPESYARSCQRKNKKLTKRKYPSTIDNFTDIYNTLTTVPNSLTNMRTFMIILLGFMGFLWFDELSKIHLSDVSFHDTYLKIFIESSKTDCYRDGCMVH